MFKLWTLLTLKFVLKIQKMSVVEKIVGASKFVFKIQNCSCFKKFVHKFQKCSCLRKMFWEIRNVWVFNSIMFFKKVFANLKNVLVWNYENVRILKLLFTNFEVVAFKQNVRNFSFLPFLFQKHVFGFIQCSNF